MMAILSPPALPSAASRTSVPAQGREGKGAGQPGGGGWGSRPHHPWAAVAARGTLPAVHAELLQRCWCPPGGGGGMHKENDSNNS